MQVRPHLDFDGRCDEAVEFYRSALGAELMMLIRYKDSPGEQIQVPPGGHDKVLHMSLLIGDTIVQASDGQCLGRPSFQGFSLSLTVPDAAETEQLFARLADGGRVQFPLARTFFSSHFGMVVDRFGVSWKIYVAN